MALLAVIFVAIASVGKTAGALLGGHLAGLNWRESLGLATGLNARGSTEVIIATIGITLGVLSEELYTLIVAMAIITTMAMPPTLRWALSRVSMRPEEQARLDKEEAAEHDLLLGVERVLVVGDGGANARLAQRIAGSFATGRQVLTTVLEAGRDEDGTGTDRARAAAEAARTRLDERADDDGAAARATASELIQSKPGTPRAAPEAAADPKAATEAIETAEDARGPDSAAKVAGATRPADGSAPRAAAEAAPETTEDSDGTDGTAGDAGERTPPVETAEDIAIAEAAKGYNLAFAGYASPLHEDGRHFAAPLARFLAETAIPVGILFGGERAEPAMAEDGAGGPRHILVTTDGSRIAALATEIAVALAHASGARLTVLHVIEHAQDASTQYTSAAAPEQTVLHNADVLARRHGVRPVLRQKSDRNPARAIGQMAETSGCDLVVLGARLREDGGKFLGPNTRRLVAQLRRAVLLVAE